MSDAISEDQRAAAQHFNEPQRARILSGVSYMDKLLIEIEEILTAPSSRAFPKYKSPLTPMQVRVARDYIKRLRHQIVSVLRDLDVHLPDPKFDASHSIRVTLQFIEVAIEETSPQRLAGYGEVPTALSARLAGGLQEMKGIVRQMDSYLIQRPDADLSQRVARLSGRGSVAELLSLLTTIIDRYGFIEFRAPLSGILEKVETPRYEIAFFGRVSAGKSSLLNRMIGTDLLPTGVTPITAVPTRIRNSCDPALVVWTGDGRVTEYAIDRIADFVTEARNPGNEKRATRVIAQLPLRNLPEEVLLVDTPGLGSLALEGAAETLAYLPQCDLGVVLVDASSNLHADDVATLDALRSASIPGLVVLSKADLAPADDIHELVGYTQRKIEEELGSKIDVSPLSSRPESGYLLDRWVTDQIAPRIAEARRLADESNQRKVSHLGERVLHALDTASRNGATTGGRSKDGQFGQAEARLREAAGLIERTNDQCFRITGNIREAAADAIRIVADAAINAWLSEDTEIDLDSKWFRKHLNAVAQAKAQELAGLIQRTATMLSEALSKAGEETSPSARNERFSLESLVKELPAADFPGVDSMSRRPRSLFLSTNLARRSLQNQLKAKYGTRVAEFFNSFGRALELWFRNTLMTLDKEFNSNAEVYRAQLQRLAGAEMPEMLNHETITADIASLRQQLRDLQDTHAVEPPAAV